MVSLQVVSRTVDSEGAVQYQFDDGTGVVFDSVAAEEAWCVESDIEVQIRPDLIRIAVCKTVHGIVNATVTCDLDNVVGNVVTVA